MIERTLALIKPDATGARNTGRIIDMVERAGLAIAAMRLVRLTRGQAAAFYSVHKGKSFYEPLLDFMASGTTVAVLLEGENAVQTWRSLMGPTDSTRAPEGTIRKLYGTNARLNAVHGSDSAEAAMQEAAFFFPGMDLAR